MGAAFEVNAATARLVRAVRRPRVLRDVVRAPLSQGDAAAVIRLVLDGVLEVDMGDRFVSGIDAWEVLGVSRDLGAAHQPGASQEQARVRDRSTRLTLAALAYGERLLPMPVTSLAYRLYRYNTVPASRRWRARLPSSRAVAEFLGTTDLERQPRFRRAGWIAQARVDRTQPWLGWTRTTALRAHAPDLPMYKLYVSPEPTRMREAFQTAALLAVGSDALAFKVGGDVLGVLRPDKLVFYFADHRALVETARELRLGLRGMRAQGVPFTAPFDPDGLVSLGVDPPSPGGADLMRRESWRLRAAGRLAASLAVAASGSSRVMSAPRFAIARLALDGLDLLATNGSEAVRRFGMELTALRSAPS
jgi:hypothetical protein